MRAEAAAFPELPSPVFGELWELSGFSPQGPGTDLCLKASPSRVTGGPGRPLPVPFPVSRAGRCPGWLAAHRAPEHQASGKERGSRDIR